MYDVAYVINALLIHTMCRRISHLPNEHESQKRVTISFIPGTNGKLRTSGHSKQCPKFHT
jgi:hypothetical protein